MWLAVLPETTVTIHARRYSEYVIAYQKPRSGGNMRTDPADAPNKTEGDAGYAACPKDDTCPIGPYSDTVNTAYYHDGLHYCIENGLMAGRTRASPMRKWSQSSGGRRGSPWQITRYGLRMWMPSPDMPRRFTGR